MVPARSVNDVHPCRRAAGPDGDGDGIGLIAALTVLPAGHPQRRVLRHRTIVAWLPMAYRQAAHYANRSEPLDDLRQVAAVGLIQAVDRYDAGLGGFSPFAVTTIHGEIKRHFRDHGWAVRVPRRLQELCLLLTSAREELVRRSHRAPGVDDLATFLGVRPDDVSDALDAAEHYRLVSLQTPCRATGDATEVGDRVGRADPRLESAADRVALHGLFKALPDRDRTILALRFFHDLNQREIAAEIGVSQVHVSRLVRDALGRLRTALVDG